MKDEHKGIEMMRVRAARPVVFPPEGNRADSQWGNSTLMGVIQNK